MSARGRPRVAVIGIGNVLLRDDGFGPTVVELLRAGWQLPEAVELIDAGTPSLDLAGYLHGRDEIILIDAVAADLAPGEIRIYGGEEILSLPLKPRVSPHDPALQEALWIVEMDGFGPRRTVLLGAAPQVVEAGTGLSPTMLDAAREAASAVIDRLVSLGCKVERRSRPSGAWWLDDGPSRATRSGRPPAPKGIAT